jgi:hypothetical protein
MKEINMSALIEGNGSCLCGKIRIAVKGINRNVGACHCGTCRNWGGGPFMAVDCGTDVSFEGEENISVYSSSEWAERGFCKECGSHLFYRLKGAHHYMMPVGLFPEVESFVFDHQVFIDEKPAYYGFSNKTQNMTGPEVFKKYSQ